MENVMHMTLKSIGISVFQVFILLSIFNILPPTGLVLANDNKYSGGVGGYGHRIEGKWIEFHVDWKDVKDTPDWDPGSGKPPPLSFKEAVLIASRELAKYVEDPAPYVLHHVGVERVFDTQKWYFTISFKMLRKRVNPDGAYDGLTVLITMDGKPVLPRESQ
jgi:hypothetical protein